MFYIILKFNFLWVPASELDETFVNNRAASSPKYWKNDEICEYRRKFVLKTSGSGNLHLRSSPWRKFWARIINEVICSTSSRRKPGWRFTAGSTLGQSGAAHAGSFDHENFVFEEKTIDECLKEWHNKFKLCIEALYWAIKTSKC